MTYQINVNMSKTIPMNWNSWNWWLDVDLNLVLLTRNAASRPEVNVLGHARPNKTRWELSSWSSNSGMRNSMEGGKQLKDRTAVIEAGWRNQTPEKRAAFQNLRFHSFLQARSLQGVLSSVWYVPVSPTSLWTQERREHFPEDDGLDPRWPSILFCLHRWHFYL